jgi:predicted  nucleic acid-binding Zn-ribbon protein
MESGKSKNIIIISLAILLLATGVWGFLEGNARKEAEELNSELLEKTSGLTTLRDQLSKEVDSLEQAYFTLSEENRALKGTVEEVNDKAAKAQRALVNERRANAGEINSLRAELEVLLDAKRDLEASIADLQSENEALKELAGALEKDLGQARKENEALANLNRAMEGEIQKLTLANFKASAFEVVLEQKNQKVTARSRKGKRLNVSFDLTNVPEEYQGIRPIYLVLTDDKSTPIQVENAKPVKIVINQQEIDLFVAKSREVSLASNQRINFSYELEDKLKPGYYRASVYTDVGLLGASNFRLR